jgi:hypothetical protein
MKNREIRIPEIGPKARVALFVLVLLAGAWLRFTGLGDESLWYDESWSWWLASGDLLHKLKTQDAHPPLYYLTLAPWIRISDSEAWMRALSALYGVLALPLMYRLGQRVKNVGLLAMAFLAFCPYHVRFSQEARSYALLFLLGAVLLNLLVDLKEKDSRWRWIAVAVVTSAMMYTHYMAAFFLLAVAGMCWFWRRPGFTKGALLALGGSLLLFAPWFPIAVDHFFVIQKDFWLPFPDGVVVAKSLGQLAISPVVLSDLRDYAWAAPIWLLVLAAPWIAKDRKLAVWILPLAFPIFGEWAVSWIRPVYYTRTFMYILLPFFVLAAAGVARLPAWAKAGAAAMVLLAFVPGLVTAKAILHKEDWRGCSEVVGRGVRPGEVVIVYPWYLKRNLEYYWRAGPPAPVWTVEGSHKTWIVDAEGDAEAIAKIVRRLDEEGVTGVWVIRRPLEGTHRPPPPAELDARFPRRYRWVERNTEVLWWAKP